MLLSLDADVGIHDAWTDEEEEEMEEEDEETEEEEEEDMEEDEEKDRGKGGRAGRGGAAFHNIVVVLNKFSKFHSSDIAFFNYG